jgi:D-aspartate ligase
MNKSRRPVLLGGDLNAYSMAASFASLGIESSVFARERLALTDTSSFIDLHILPELCDFNKAAPALLSFAKQHAGEELILVPCADWYMEMIEYARDALDGHFRFLIPDFEVWRTVSDKATFLKIMDKYGINHPKTEVFDSCLISFDRKCGGMKPPFVIKPSDSSEYWKHPFVGMKKVYFADTVSESRDICDKIFSSGYPGRVLVQEYVGESRKRALASVLTTFSGSDGRVVRAVLGDVLLEERGDRARGNYSAIITRPLDAMAEKIIRMLEGIKYTGIANLDILYYGGESYCLELNPRQGRSFDYVRGAGVNLAELILGELDGVSGAASFSYPMWLWRSVTRRTLAKYTDEPGLLSLAEKLERDGYVITPYDSDTDRGILRRLYVAAHLLRERGRYKRQRENSGICY